MFANKLQHTSLLACAGQDGINRHRHHPAHGLFGCSQNIKYPVINNNKGLHENTFHAALCHQMDLYGPIMYHPFNTSQR